MRWHSSSAILTDLFCNKTALHHDITTIWHNTDTVGKIQSPYINKSCDNTDTDHQTDQEIWLKPPQDIILIENEWSKEELANHKLISMLNSPVQVYHEIQTVVYQVGNQ